MKRLALALPLLLVACADYPRDIEGTSETVTESGTIRVGMIAGSAVTPASHAFLARLQRQTGASTRLTTGSAEPLLLALEAGELDLVIGELAKDSPWAKDVAVIEPIAARRAGEDEIHLAPIVRNGENRWMMAVERAARDMGQSGAPRA